MVYLFLSHIKLNVFQNPVGCFRNLNRFFVLFLARFHFGKGVGRSLLIRTSSLRMGQTRRGQLATP